ncbi:palmitoyl-protein thioesterase 1-like isoform X4 [Mangifera indica]|uniref:palmitoyl-protein thioesterase 1-like isoform X4 n=1 Tax=Mangifera indica TaxID=29780 RepID=UPI001CFAF8F6|nr:palmitoyl-protein thioesterase 1-like isoform X4 [Mangifera indica]
MALHLLPISILFIFISLLFPVSLSIPFIVLHGIGDQCSNRGVNEFTKKLSKFAGVKGYCIEVGDGKWDSWFKPLEEQGNLIARGVIEFCDGGPLSGIFCIIADTLIKSEIYSDYVQAHLAPSGYLKFPNDMSKYLSKCKFLPKLNNEHPDKRNSTYKERFSSLQNLVLIMFEDDKVLIPKETSWFGYYPCGGFKPVLPPQKTKLYTEDWIGLKSLDDTGRVKYISVAGGHLGISEADIKKHVVPYLKDQALVRTS